MSHDRRRLMLRYFGHVDLGRLWRANIAIGNASWCHAFSGCFGDPNALHHTPRAHVIKFPAKAGRLRDGRC